VNILETLSNAYDKHITDTGNTPRKALYLGARQHRQLDVEMNRGPLVPQQVAGYAPRRRFMTLPVYRVDADDYIHFT
jgi:hypothetical protein